MGGTEVFGLRLMWESLDDLSRRLDAFFPGLPTDSARFEAAFGPCRYIHLSREDKVAQAVSLWKADQTGLWHVDADGTERERTKAAQTPIYDSEALSGLVAELEDHDAAWARWFRQQRIVPLSITYEMLSSEPQGTLALVLAALGLDESIANAVQPKTAILADSESREWVERFRKERHGPME